MEVLSSGNSPFTVTIAELVRGLLVGGNSYQRVLPLCLGYLPNVPVAHAVCPGGRVYSRTPISTWAC